MDFSQYTHHTQLIIGFFFTLFAYILAHFTTRILKRVPVIVIAMVYLVILLWLISWHFDAYYAQVSGLFNHLLGYVTVALAIPLAALRFEDLKLKPLSLILIFASVVGVVFPMLLAYLLHLSTPTILAFATRALTTPVALNISDIIHSPSAMVTLIVVISGILGAVLASSVLKNIKDERAAGLAMGLAAHAIGTAQAWQRSVVAGRYAALGMALNAVITGAWLPLIYLLFFKG